MTRVDKSPEPIEPLIVALRSALREELGYVPTTTRTVPSQVEVIVERVTADGEWIACKWPQEPTLDAGQLGGPALSIPFSRYLDRQYGSAFPVAAALSVVRHECRRGHTGHADRDEWRGSLCHRLSVFCVYWGLSAAVAARECGIDLDHADKLLRRAIERINEHMAQRRAVPSEYSASEPTPSQLAKWGCEAYRRAVANFDLEERIWAGLRQRDPSLRSWEDEWADRQAKLLDHRAECERCRGSMAA